MVCTLATEMLHGRLADWRATLRRATSVESTERGARFRFSDDIDVAALANLAASEQRCCSFLTFGLGFGPGQVTLEIRGPADARPLLDEFVQLAGQEPDGEVVRGASPSDTASAAPASDARETLISGVTDT